MQTGGSSPTNSPVKFGRNSAPNNDSTDSAAVSMVRSRAYIYDHLTCSRMTIDRFIRKYKLDDTSGDYSGPDQRFKKTKELILGVLSKEERHALFERFK